MSELKARINETRINELMDAVEEQITAPPGVEVLDSDELFDILYLLFSHKFILQSLTEDLEGGEESE